MTALIVPEILAGKLNATVRVLCTDPHRAVVQSVREIDHPDYNTEVHFRIYDRTVNVTTDDLTGKPYRVKRALCNRTPLNEYNVSVAFLLEPTLDREVWVHRLNNLSGGVYVTDDFLPTPTPAGVWPGDPISVTVACSNRSLVSYGSVTFNMTMPYPVRTDINAATHVGGQLHHDGGYLTPGLSAAGMKSQGIHDIEFVVPPSPSEVYTWLDNRNDYTALSQNLTAFLVFTAFINGTRVLRYMGPPGDSETYPINTGDRIRVKFKANGFRIFINGVELTTFSSVVLSYNTGISHLVLAGTAPTECMIYPSTF